jgi:tetratricopeptide (TPR) repeat protein
VYNDDTSPNLGDPEHALASARRLLNTSVEMVRADPNNTDAKAMHAVANRRVAYSLREFDPDAAVRIARESVQIWDELVAGKKADDVVRLAMARRTLAQALLKANRASEARRSVEAALAIQQSPEVKATMKWADQVELVHSLVVAAEANSACGDHQNAEKLLLQARQVAVELSRRPELSALFSLANAEEALGGFYARWGPKAEARACYERLVALWSHYPESNEYVTRKRDAAARLLAGLR